MKAMKLLFVIDRIGFQEVLSIPVLSAVAKASGHQVELLEFNRSTSNPIRAIESYAPDVIAYSICSNECERYLKINALLKNQISFFSVFGGPHATFFPKLIDEAGVDATCRGEGDVVFGAFLNAFGTGAMYEVSNFTYKLPDGKRKENQLSPLVSDLDSLPFPDRDLIYARNHFLAQSPIKSFFAGRGCPFNCSYCFNHAYNELYRGKGKTLRTKSVAYLVAEINQTRARYPLSFVKFQDDVFGVHRAWLEEFAERYPQEIGLPFMCYCRPNMVTDTYARLLKEAGCYSACVAFESGNEQIRRSVLNRKMDNDQILRACSRLKGEGIRVYALNMIGLPGETEAEVLETLELNQQARVDFADASIFQPYPGTRITEYCKEIGLLNDGQGGFESQFTTSILNFPADYKRKVETIHRLFSIMVDHPGVRYLYPVLARLRGTKLILNILYRFYYGVNLHRRIYAGQIPFLLRLRNALPLLFSRNRT